MWDPGCRDWRGKPGGRCGAGGRGSAPRAPVPQRPPALPPGVRVLHVQRPRQPKVRHLGAAVAAVGGGLAVQRHGAALRVTRDPGSSPSLSQLTGRPCTSECPLHPLHPPHPRPPHPHDPQRAPPWRCTRAGPPCASSAARCRASSRRALREGRQAGERASWVDGWASRRRAVWARGRPAPGKALAPSASLPAALPLHPCCPPPAPPTDVELVDVAHALGHLLGGAQQRALRGGSRGRSAGCRGGPLGVNTPIGGRPDSTWRLQPPRSNPHTAHVGGLEGPLGAGAEGAPLERLAQRACGAGRWWAVERGGAGLAGDAACKACAAVSPHRRRPPIWPHQASRAPAETHATHPQPPPIHPAHPTPPRSTPHTHPAGHPPRSQYSMTTAISASCPARRSSSSWNTSRTPPPARGGRAGGWAGGRAGGRVGRNARLDGSMEKT